MINSNSNRTGEAATPPSSADSPLPPGADADTVSKAERQDFNPMVSVSRAIRPHGIEAAKPLAREAARVALDNNAADVVVLDVSGQSAEFDLFVLATGTSRRQLHAISEQIDDVLQKDLGDTRHGIEGYQESSWIILDYGNVVIHLFDEDTRAYYDLESLWADGSPIALGDLGLDVDANGARV